MPPTSGLSPFSDRYPRYSNDITVNPCYLCRLDHLASTASTPCSILRIIEPYCTSVILPRKGEWLDRVLSYVRVLSTPDRFCLQRASKYSTIPGNNLRATPASVAAAAAARLKNTRDLKLQALNSDNLS